MDKAAFNQRHPVGSRVTVTLQNKSTRIGIVKRPAAPTGGNNCIAVRIEYVDGLRPKGGTFPISAVSAVS